jgi:hypothetical protein
VPRKAFDYQHGFQRTLSDSRVIDIVQYFRENPENISPTSVVIGLSEEVKFTALKSKVPGLIDLVRVTITLPDLALLSLEDLANRALEKLRLRLPPADIEEIESTPRTNPSDAL